jgi:hypothetical protein
LHGKIETGSVAVIFVRMVSFESLETACGLQIEADYDVAANVFLV